MYLQILQWYPPFDPDNRSYKDTKRKSSIFITKGITGTWITPWLMIFSVSACSNSGFVPSGWIPGKFTPSKSIGISWVISILLRGVSRSCHGIFLKRNRLFVKGSKRILRWKNRVYLLNWIILNVEGFSVGIGLWGHSSDMFSVKKRGLAKMH